MKLIIEDDEGRQTVVPFLRDEITIGRQEGNDVRLTERNVSRRHARLRRQNGHVIVEDVGSSYGIHVNGKRIREPITVGDGDLIQIGDYDLAIQQEGQQAEPVPLRSRTPDPDADDDEEGLPDEDTASGLGELTDPSADLSRLPTAVMPSPLAAAHAVEELDPEHAPRLVVLNTALAGREFACIRTDLRVGRADENDISIDHPSLGRSHARLTLEGEQWKIVDLGTSNGISHNDAPCHEAELQSGDLLEIGTVRFKFLGPGVPFRFDPRAEYLPPKRGKGGKVLGIAAAVVILGGLGGVGALRYLHHQPPFDHLRPGTKPPASPVATAPAHPQESGLAAQNLTVAATLQQAREAMGAKQFEQAVKLLEGIPSPSGDDAALLQTLLAKARKEQSAQSALALAKDALARADYKAARSALEDAKETEAFARERADLLRQISDAQTDALYEQGRNELKTGKFREATDTFGRCLAIDATAARCHMLLGASFANLAASEPNPHARSGELEQAVAHYRKFLQYAGPDDAKEAEKVKAILRSYEGGRR